MLHCDTRRGVECPEWSTWVTWTRSQIRFLEVSNTLGQRTYISGNVFAKDRVSASGSRAPHRIWARRIVPHRFFNKRARVRQLRDTSHVDVFLSQKSGMQFLDDTLFDVRPGRQDERHTREAAGSGLRTATGKKYGVLEYFLVGHVQGVALLRRHDFHKVMARCC